MSKSNVILAAVVSWSLVTVASLAQETNSCALLPATKLEVMEAATGTVIVKGTTTLGSVSVTGGNLSVTSKEDTDTGSGRKEYGIALTIRASNQFEDRTIVDFDEMDSLLNAVDYLSAVKWSVTSLSSFNATYTTKGGFRIAANGRKRLGTIEFSMRGSHMSKGTPITPSELARFRALIDEAKRALDSIRSGK